MLSSQRFAIDAIRTSFLQHDGLPFSNVLSADEIDVALSVPETADSPGNSDAQPVIYTPAVTLWAFLSQMLYKKELRSCQAAVERVITWLETAGLKTPSDNTGTYCRARARLPLSGLQGLVRTVADGCEHEVAQNCEQWKWHGRRVQLIDGSTFSMPDTAANQLAYPQHGAQKAGVGFPVVRAVMLISMATGIINDLAMGKYMGKETGETALFRELMERLSREDVVVADRYYAGWWTIAILNQRGVDIVTRLHQHRTADFRQGTQLGRQDHIVEWRRPARPKWLDNKTYESLPETLRVRELQVQVEEAGFRTRSLIVVTTLTDGEEYSSDDLAALYRQRWQIEIDVRWLKCTLDLDVLRAQSPEMVRKELWAGLLAANLIRRLILQAALGTDRTPREISFTAVLQKVVANFQTILQLDQSGQVRVINRPLKALLRHRIGHRPNRVEPRAIKRRPKSQKLLNEPRDQARARLAVVPDGTEVPHSPDAIEAANKLLQSEMQKQTLAST